MLGLAQFLLEASKYKADRHTQTRKTVAPKAKLKPIVVFSPGRTERRKFIIGRSIEFWIHQRTIETRLKMLEKEVESLN